MSDEDAEKRRAAERAVALVESGMRVGLGTGSAAAHAVRLLGARVREGLKITAIATSRATEELAVREGIALVTFHDLDGLDLTIDGADEVDPQLRLIKGGGGALLREKIVADASARFVVIAQSSKRVPKLGRFPLPVEVIPLAVPLVRARLRELCPDITLRAGKEGAPFVTDNGNHILDCAFGAIDDPPALAYTLDAMVGVVDHGLFLGMAERALLGTPDGVDELFPV